MAPVTPPKKNSNTVFPKGERKNILGKKITKEHAQKYVPILKYNTIEILCVYSNELKFKCVGRFCELEQLDCPPKSCKLSDSQFNLEKGLDIFAKRRKHHWG